MDNFKAILRGLLFVGALVLASGQDDTALPCADPESPCTLTCDFGYKNDANGCPLCECEEKTCQDIQCAVGKVCQVYTLRSSGHKISRCVDISHPEKCWPPMDPGICQDRQEKYFYNTERDVCEPFVFSGCGDNGNMFDTMEECSDLCLEPCPDLATCQLSCPDGYESDERGCRTCACKHTCSDEVMCQRFCDYGFQKDEHGCDVCECEPCPQMICQMYCPTGFQTDSDGCEICVCQESQPNSCSDFMCQLYCEDGMPLDADGCPICECLDLYDPDSCSENPCPTTCEHGFVQDSNGCDTCECSNSPNILNAATPECGGVTCQRYCPTGFETDERGCNLCRCKDNVTCPDMMCQLFCEDGFLTDELGCDTCACRVGAPDCEPVLCQMYCEFGLRKDALGCPTCVCEEDPCDFVECPSGQRCIVEMDQTLPTCIKEEAHTWCPPYMCAMYCEKGFKSDQLGCETCSCLTEKKPACSSDVTCQMYCRYGFRFDQFGCRTCECLPDPCATKGCQENFVCEAKDPECPTCPAIAVCIGRRQVQRIEITISYSHDEVEDIDLPDFKSSLKRRMHYLLDMDEDYIRAISVDQEGHSRTTVMFHVVSYGQGDIVQTYEDFKADITAHLEGTALKYDGVTFVPDHNSLVASYSHDPNVEYDDDDDEFDDDDDDDSEVSVGLIVGCTIAGIVALVLLIVVIVFVVKANKKNKKAGAKPNVAYQKAPVLQTGPETNQPPQV